MNNFSYNMEGVALEMIEEHIASYISTLCSYKSHTGSYVNSVCIKSNRVTGFLWRNLATSCTVHQT